MTTEQHNDDQQPEFGDNRFVLRRDGVRRRTGMTRSVLPRKNDTNESFERWTQTLAQRLMDMFPDIESVDLRYELRDDAIVKCHIEALSAESPEPIRPDPRPAGGRVEARGSRGGQKPAGLRFGLSPA